MRMDKWLWAARFFKTRSLAGKACDLGRIESNGLPSKASREVRVGDQLQVKNGSGIFVLEVLTLSEIRGPGAVAQTLFQETEASREARWEAAEDRKILISFEAIPESKPSKRERRELAKLRGRD